MKKQYNVPKAEKVEFSYEQNVVASGYWKGDLTWLNDKKCFCKWVEG